MPITALQDLLRGPNLFLRRAGHAKGASELVGDVLVGRGHRASHGLLPNVVRALPVRIRVAAREPWACFVVVLVEMRFGRALAVITHQRGLPSRRALELLFRHALACRLLCGGLTSLWLGSFLRAPRPRALLGTHRAGRERTACHRLARTGLNGPFVKSRMYGRGRFSAPKRRGREHPAPRPPVHRGLHDDAAPAQSTDAVSQLRRLNAEQAREAARRAEDRALEIPSDETIERGGA